MVFDESMYDYFPYTINTGGQRNISFIESKPELLKNGFKSICCDITGIIMFLEIQRGKFDEVPLCYIGLNTTTYRYLQLDSIARSCGYFCPFVSRICVSYPSKWPLLCCIPVLFCPYMLSDGEGFPSVQRDNSEFSGFVPQGLSIENNQVLSIWVLPCHRAS